MGVVMGVAVWGHDRGVASSMGVVMGVAATLTSAQASTTAWYHSFS